MSWRIPSAALYLEGVRERTDSMVHGRTISRLMSFPTILDAARSTSTSPGLSSRRTLRSFLAAAACLVTVVAVVRSAGLASEAFQPESRTAERLLDAVFTARIALALRSAGVCSTALPFPLPLESEIVSLVASLSASSSGDVAAVALAFEDEAVRVVRDAG